MFFIYYNHSYNKSLCLKRIPQIDKTSKNKNEMPGIVISSVLLYQICSFQDCDVHFFAALLKNYLRELPVPLLGRKEGHVHDRWVEVPALPTKEARVKEIRYILKEDLPSNVVINIQYLVKMLAELTKKSDVNKMTTSNLGIVIGPSLLWKIGGSTTSQQNNIEKVIKVRSEFKKYFFFRIFLLVQIWWKEPL